MANLDPSTPQERGATLRLLHGWTTLLVWRALGVGFAGLVAMLVYFGLKPLGGLPYLGWLGGAPRQAVCAGVFLPLALYASGVLRRINRQLHRPVLIGTLGIVLLAGLVMGLMRQNLYPAWANEAAWLSNPLFWFNFALLMLGMWALGLPAWPPRRPWWRHRNPPFQLTPPGEEAIALLITRWLALALPPTLGLILYGPQPFFTWPAGLLAGYWLEQQSRQPESPNPHPHLLCWLEWLGWAGFCALLAIGQLWPRLQDNYRREAQVGVFALPILLCGVAALRQHLRRPTAVSILWLWPASIGLLAHFMWPARPTGPVLQNAAMHGAPLLWIMPAVWQRAVAMLTLIMFARVLLRALSAYWWLLVGICLLGLAWVAGPMGIALLWPLAALLWLLQRQIVTGRLKWMSLAGMLIGLCWVWHPTLHIWMGLGLLLYCVVLGLHSTTIMESPLEPHQTRWFALAAAGLGLVPSLVASLGALWWNHRGDALLTQALQLRGVLWSGMAEEGSSWMLMLLCPGLLLAVWWCFDSHLRPRRLHPLASVLLLVWCLAMLGWLDVLLGGWLRMAAPTLMLGALLVPLVLAWRSGPAWQLPVPLHAPLLRGLLLCLLILVALAALPNRDYRSRPAAAPHARQPARPTPALPTPALPDPDLLPLAP